MIESEPILFEVTYWRSLQGTRPGFVQLQRLDDQYSVLAAVLLHPIGLRCTHIMWPVARLKAAGMIYEILFCNAVSSSQWKPWLGLCKWSIKDSWRNSYPSLHISSSCRKTPSEHCFLVKTKVWAVQLNRRSLLLLVAVCISHTANPRNCKPHCFWALIEDKYSAVLSFSSLKAKQQKQTQTKPFFSYFIWSKTWILVTGLLVSTVAVLQRK